MKKKAAIKIKSNRLLMSRWENYKTVKQNCRPKKMNYSKCIILRFTAFTQKISKRLQKEHRLIKV